jgi:hypothetical protein
MARGRRDKWPTALYLDDILVEIEFLKGASAGLTFAQYIGSGEKRRAIERSLEILSEAARGVPDADAALHPEVPWRRIRDLGTSFAMPISGWHRSGCGQLFNRNSIRWSVQSARCVRGTTSVTDHHSAAWRCTV